MRTSCRPSGVRSCPVRPQLARAPRPRATSLGESDLHAVLRERLEEELASARGGVERLQRTLREEREAFAFQLGALNAAAAKERAEWQAKLLLERGETLAARASAQKDIAAATKAAAEAAHKERAAQMKALAVAAEVHRAEVSKLAGELAEERRSGSGPVASQRARLESLRLSAASSLRAAASASGQGRAGAASEEVAALREQLRAEKAARVAAEERLLALFKAQSG